MSFEGLRSVLDAKESAVMDVIHIPFSVLGHMCLQIGRGPRIRETTMHLTGFVHEAILWPACKQGNAIWHWLRSAQWTKPWLS